MRLVKEQLDILKATTFFRNPQTIGEWTILIQKEAKVVEALWLISDDGVIYTAIARLAAMCILALLRTK
jgi:hypothetical protein